MGYSRLFSLDGVRLPRMAAERHAAQHLAADRSSGSINCYLMSWLAAARFVGDVPVAGPRLWLISPVLSVDLARTAEETIS